MDVICTHNWISKLKWINLKEFQNAPRTVHLINGIPNGYSKEYKNFIYYDILKAGHMVII